MNHYEPVPKQDQFLLGFAPGFPSGIKVSSIPVILHWSRLSRPDQRSTSYRIGPRLPRPDRERRDGDARDYHVQAGRRLGCQCGERIRHISSYFVCQSVRSVRSDRSVRSVRSVRPVHGQLPPKPTGFGATAVHCHIRSALQPCLSCSPSRHDEARSPRTNWGRTWGTSSPVRNS